MKAIVLADKRCTGWADATRNGTMYDVDGVGAVVARKVVEKGVVSFYSDAPRQFDAKGSPLKVHCLGTITRSSKTLVLCWCTYNSYYSLFPPEMIDGNTDHGTPADYEEDTLYPLKDGEKVDGHKAMDITKRMFRGG